MLWILFLAKSFILTEGIRVSKSLNPRNLSLECDSVPDDSKPLDLELERRIVTTEEDDGHKVIFYEYNS